jgi:Rrf2 family protein
MKISTRGRYATRALLVLAARHGEGLTHINDLAVDQAISRKYLENILLSLKLAGLVLSERGKNGGYALARPPAEITMHDILVNMEDSLDYVPCTAEDADCDRLDNCATREFWVELKHSTESVLKGTTLADLLERQQTLDADRPMSPGDCAPRERRQAGATATGSTTGPSAGSSAGSDAGSRPDPVGTPGSSEA